MCHSEAWNQIGGLVARVGELAEVRRFIMTRAVHTSATACALNERSGDESWLLLLEIL
jgi:hypothetical protein